MLQLHLSDQQLYCILTCNLYHRFDVMLYFLHLFRLVALTDATSLMVTSPNGECIIEISIRYVSSAICFIWFNSFTFIGCYHEWICSSFIASKHILLTPWGRMTHICTSKLLIIGSGNGLAHVWHQAVIWTSVGILSTGSSGTNCSESWIKMQQFSFKKMQLNISSAKWRSFCLGLYVLKNWDLEMHTCIS